MLGGKMLGGKTLYSLEVKRLELSDKSRLLLEVNYLEVLGSPPVERRRGVGFVFDNPYPPLVCQRVCVCVFVSSRLATVSLPFSRLVHQDWFSP